MVGSEGAVRGEVVAEIEAEQLVVENQTLAEVVRRRRGGLGLLNLKKVWRRTRTAGTLHGDLGLGKVLLGGV
jgi:hypothetical protein